MAKISWRGVNIAGAEGGSKKSGSEYPGVINKDYTWPKASSIQPWLDQKASIVRYCIAWERVQSELNGPLRSDATSPLDSMATLVTDTGAIFLIDIHNYMERARQSDGQKIQINTDGELTIEHYADFVGKLAERYKDNPLVAIGLMNEPHDLEWNDGSSSAVGLRRAYQAAIDAARETGFEGFLTYCPSAWAKVANLDAEMGEELAQLNDPLNKLINEVHQYPDNGEQGDDNSIANNDPDIYEKRLAKGTEWSKKHDLPIMLGEFGTPNTDLGEEVQTNLITYLEENGWWGYTAWCAGPWWPDSYFYFLEPVDGVPPRTVAPLKLGTDFPESGSGGGGGGGGGGTDPGPEPEPDTDLDERVEDLEDSVQDLDNRLSTVEADLADLKSRVSALEAGGGGGTGGGGDEDLANRVAILETSVSDLDKRLDAVASGAAG